MMTPWQHAFRTGFAPLLSTPALEALAAGLERNDPDLIQGQTTEPLPLHVNAAAPVEACCPVGYALWKSAGLTTVEEVDEAFCHVCFEAGKALGEPAAVRFFMNWVDDAARARMRQELLAEVNRELDGRAGLPAAA